MSICFLYDLPDSFLSVFISCCSVSLSSAQYKMNHSLVIFCRTALSLPASCHPNTPTSHCSAASYSCCTVPAAHRGSFKSETCLLQPSCSSCFLFIFPLSQHRQKYQTASDDRENPAKLFSVDSPILITQAHKLLYSSSTRFTSLLP